jgi:predicted nucleic acid-binding protein
LVVILDTNAVSSLLAGGNQQLNALLESANQHHLPLAVIAEYQYGLLALHNPRRLELLLRKLEADSIVLYPDRATADTYAAIRHDLRTRGRPIPENDLWIAALARQHSLEIVSQDPHFDHVEGIRRISW